MDAGVEVLEEAPEEVLVALVPLVDLEPLEPLDAALKMQIRAPLRKRLVRGFPTRLLGRQARCRWPDSQSSFT